MARYIQRYPCQPKATWWKRYAERASLGKRTIYVATPELGFEVDGFPQILTSRGLSRGVLNTNDAVEYIGITKVIDGVLTSINAIRLLDKYYMFNPNTRAMEEQDIADEGIIIIHAETNDIIRLDKNAYVRKFAFDCIRENDQQSSVYQPIQGLLTDSTFLTIKTHNFCDAKTKPQCEDLLFYNNRFWMIEDTRETFVYTPRETATLHLAIKQIKK